MIRRVCCKLLKKCYSTSLPPSAHPSRVLCRLEEHYDNVLAEDLLVLSYDHRYTNPSSPIIKEVIEQNEALNKDFREYEAAKIKERAPITEKKVKKKRQEFPKRDVFESKSLVKVVKAQKVGDTEYKKFLDTVPIDDESINEQPNAYERLPRLLGIRIKTIMTNAVTHSKKILLPGMLACQLITGVHAEVYRSKEADSVLRTRKGMPIGVQAIINDEHKMYNFVDKFVEIVLPKIRDFNGFSVSSGGDGSGRTVKITMDSEAWESFPEIELAYLKFPQRNTPGALQPFDIEFITSAKSDEEARLLLSGFKIPFTFREELKPVEKSERVEDDTQDV